MIIIIVAVYKSCNKNRENDLRRDINTSFIHMGAGGTGETSQADANYYSNFPQPPPPYGLVVDASTAYIPPMPPSQVAPLQPPPVAPPLAGFKPNHHQANPSNPLNDQTGAALNPQPAQQSTTGWSSFLAGAAVGGVTSFLLNRRK